MWGWEGVQGIPPKTSGSAIATSISDNYIHSMGPPDSMMSYSDLLDLAGGNLLSVKS